MPEQALYLWVIVPMPNSLLHSLLMAFSVQKCSFILISGKNAVHALSDLLDLSIAPSLTNGETAFRALFPWVNWNYYDCNQIGVSCNTEHIKKFPGMKSIWQWCSVNHNLHEMKLEVKINFKTS